MDGFDQSINVKVSYRFKKNRDFIVLIV
jgi:26S proteasome regulatory subunit T3